MTDHPAAQSCTTKTTCPYCGVGCGVLATRHEDGSVLIKGDPDHPANFGRLCSKGASLGETFSMDDRLLFPSIEGERTEWDNALNLVASKFQSAIAEYGPGSVAFYVSGQILTEDYYVANKLMKGFIGSANIDTNSRLCMASSVAGHKRAFGSDTVPGLYEDLEKADLVILVGSNLAWCHPVTYQRLEAARKERGTRVIVIDPRRTATAETADLHLPLTPGSDVALFNGLLHWLAERDAVDQAYVDAHTTGFDEAVTAAVDFNLHTVADRTGIEMSRLVSFFDAFTKTERVVTVYSQGVNQSTAGTDKVNAIINCHLATGRIGREGMGPFSITGQPNAMGGRETGGLANQLAAHMDLGNPDHTAILQEFWQSEKVATGQGLKAVDLFRAIERGEIKALWIMATNPAVSLPDADRVRDAIKSCDFVVVSDVNHRTDTVEHADVLLPALGWGEKDGLVTNSERRMSRQRAFMEAPGEAKADWWALCEVAKRMGWADAFDFKNASAIIREYAALTGFKNHGSRDLDISALEDISDEEFDALEPTLWPCPKGEQSQTRFFADGGFYTPDRKARFLALEDRRPAMAATEAYPLLLNTGRIRDQWHTMTRTGMAAQLSQHFSEPFLEISALDAANLGLEAADIAQLESPTGRCLLRVLLSERVSPGQVFAPLHWNAQWASAGRIDSLIASHVDPVSGQPESKCAPVKVSKYGATWFGFAVTRDRLDASIADYWARGKTHHGWRTEMAGTAAMSDWTCWFKDAVGATDEMRVIVSEDLSTGRYHAAAYDGDLLVAALHVAAEPVMTARSWLSARVGTVLNPEDQVAVIAGRPGGRQPDTGAIVCSCHSVGIKKIQRAITQEGCRTLDAVGVCTNAGTNCGACRAEISVLLSNLDMKEAG